MHTLIRQFNKFNITNNINCIKKINNLYNINKVNKVNDVRNLNNLCQSSPPLQPLLSTECKKILVPACVNFITFIAVPYCAIKYINRKNHMMNIEMRKETDKYKNENIPLLHAEIEAITHTRQEFTKFATSFFERQMDNNVSNLYNKIFIYKYIEKNHLNTIKNENILNDLEIFNKYISYFKGIDINVNPDVNININDEKELMIFNEEIAKIKNSYKNLMNKIVEKANLMLM